MQLRMTLMLLTVLLLALALHTPGRAIAATGSVTAYIGRVLMTGDSTFGGCMAALSVSPQSVLPSCQSTWVTFSCSGYFTDPVRAYRMVDVAELALATNKRVQVFFRDTSRHNGYCFADRIDVLR